MLKIVTFAATAYFAQIALSVFMQGKTSSILATGAQSLRRPSVAIAGNWVSESKLRNLTSFTDEFWAAEEVLKQQNINGVQQETLPMMCNFIRALFITNIDVLAKNDNIAGLSERTTDLARLLSEQEFIKTNGFQQFAARISIDPEDVILGALDKIGRSVPLQVRRQPIQVGIAYEARFQTGANLFTEGFGAVRILLNRSTEGLGVCALSRMMHLILQDEGDVPDETANYIALSTTKDYQITVSRQIVKLKNRPSSPCAERKSNYCLLKCMHRFDDCECDTIHMNFEEERFTIYNISNICHRYQPLAAQCPLIRFVRQVKYVQQCERQCISPCEQTIYQMTAQQLAPKSETELSLEFDFKQTVSTLHIEEFYIYNKIALACTLCAHFSMMFGYSFVTYCKFILQCLEQSCKRNFALKRELPIGNG